MFQLRLLESQGFAKPTNPLLGTYVLLRATKTTHICICPNQRGCDEMNQAPIPLARPQLLHYFIWFKTNLYIQNLSLAHEPP
jgi:hypothetical protein